MLMCIATVCVACTSKDDSGNTPAPQQDKDIRILAIGNSFSVDAMQYLYGILEDAGYEEIVLGNIYKGGCSLEQHSSRFEDDNGSDYTYYKNISGEWTETEGCFPRKVLQEEEWDYITMQQVSGKSGQAATYEPYLSDLLEIVTLYCPDASLAWHMTWAYQGNSGHNDFGHYGKDQMTMYNAIVGTVQNTVMSKGVFVKVIPNGTAVQNLRTSYMGDNLTRDGYHMSHDKGRYLAALTFAKALTGCDLSVVDYTPSGYSYTAQDILAMKEAADNACKTPYSVTVSSYPPEQTPEDNGQEEEQPGDNVPVENPFESVLSENGKDIDDYEALDLGLIRFAYYNSSEDATDPDKVYMASTATGNTYKKFVATKIFEKSEIPSGSLIVVLNGYQYRPEGWTALDVLNGTGSGNSGITRPGNVTTGLVEVNDAWWGSWKYRAFNLAKTSTPFLNDTTVEEVCNSFAIFVPKIEH